MADSTITVAPIAGAIGAEIAGADLSTALSDDSVAAIRQALLDHLVVFFRDQELTPRQFMAFARCFGEPVAYPFVKGLDDFPEITPIIKREEDRSNFGGLWHFATVYPQLPPMGTILHGLAIPTYRVYHEIPNHDPPYETIAPPPPPPP